MIVVYGTRPEAHKLHTILQSDLRCTLVCSGQHTSLLQETQSDPVFAGQKHLGLPSDDDPIHYADRLVDELLRTDLPDGPVLVQGDTATAAGAACWATKTQRPIIHLEAGVRSENFEEPWPEEIFRVSIDHFAHYGFCATGANQRNLYPPLSDGIAGRYITDRFPITGNPGIDRSYQLVPPSTNRDTHVLITLHRRESFGERLDALVDAVSAAASSHPGRLFFWPVHPNPAVQRAAQHARNLVLLPPQPHLDFLKLLSRAAAVLTDSGGVQEEAAAYGIPCLVARTVTDRPESVHTGHARLTTPDTLPQDLKDATGFGFPSTPSHIFGDGQATPRILQHLKDWGFSPA